MTPLMFGPASRQLFGMFHPAETAVARPSSVLVCPPFGKEALRAHRFFRVLAERLASRGVSCLRFDYHCSGDSPGDEADGELEGWRRDIRSAHGELRRLAPTSRIVWIGARLGATLAVLAARNGRCDPARLVLWEPIVDGPRYGSFLRKEHVLALDATYCIPNLVWRRELARDPHAMPSEALGIELSPNLQRQLAALSAQALPLTALHDTLVLAEHDDDGAAHWAAVQHARNMPVRFAYFQHTLVWTSDPYPNSAMVPPDALLRLQGAVNE